MAVTFKRLRRIGPSFEAYLGTVYGARAAQLPPVQRNELEQAYAAVRHASLTFNFERGKPKA